MVAGFEVTNDNGRVQVIDQAPLITHINKVVVPLTAPNERFWLSGQHILAAEPSNNNYLFYTYYDTFFAPNDPATGSRYHYRAVGEGKIHYFGYSIAPTTTENYGLEIFNASGGLQFSSNQRPLRVLDMVIISDIRSNWVDAYGTKQAWYKDYGNKKVAVIFIQVPTWNDSKSYLTVGAIKRNSLFSLERVVEAYDSNANDGGGIVASWGLKALIVDVTGY